MGHIIKIKKQIMAAQSDDVEGNNDGKFAGDLKEN